MSILKLKYQKQILKVKISQVQTHKSIQDKCVNESKVLKISLLMSQQN